MGIFFVLVAAMLVAISNFCMRRSIDAGGSSKAYLVVQLTFSFFVMIVLNPVRTGDYTWGGAAVSLGALGGVMLGALMWGVGKTLEKGPPGLSFAFLNASSIFPAIFLFLLFGAAFGHSYTLWNGFGSILVLAGLFWAGWTTEMIPHKAVWLLFALFILLMHTLFLAYLQWWAMLLRPDLPQTVLLPLKYQPVDIQWFMPSALFVAALFQWVVYLTHEKQMPKGAEIYYGILGGVTNGACTFFLILAPQKSAPWENAMLFPIFSVSVILLCNVWAQILYRERVNWKANTLCVLGLVIGTVAWTSI